MLRIRVADALCHMKRIAGWVLGCIDVCLSIETDRVDDQRIAFPFAYGMSHPTRFQIFGMITSIQMDDVKNIVRFIEEGQAIGLVHDREWILYLTCPRVPPRQAVSREINSGIF